MELRDIIWWFMVCWAIAIGCLFGGRAYGAGSGVWSENETTSGQPWLYLAPDTSSGFDGADNQFYTQRDSTPIFPLHSFAGLGGSEGTLGNAFAGVPLIDGWGSFQRLTYSASGVVSARELVTVSVERVDGGFYECVFSGAVTAVFYVRPYVTNGYARVAARSGNDTSDVWQENTLKMRASVWGDLGTIPDGTADGQPPTTQPNDDPTTQPFDQTDPGDFATTQPSNFPIHWPQISPSTDPVGDLFTLVNGLGASSLPSETGYTFGTTNIKLSDMLGGAGGLGWSGLWIGVFQTIASVRATYTVPWEAVRLLLTILFSIQVVYALVRAFHFGAGIAYGSEPLEPD